MGVTHDSGTRITLLGRLRKNPGDQAAWNELVVHYGSKIQAWCLRWGLQEADAQDVTQDVLVKLAAKMRNFSYDPSQSFRNWLKTVTRHALSDFVADRDRRAAGSVCFDGQHQCFAGDVLRGDAVDEGSDLHWLGQNQLWQAVAGARLWRADDPDRGRF